MEKLLQYAIRHPELMKCQGIIGGLSIAAIHSERLHMPAWYKGHLESQDIADDLLLLSKSY